jgi:hypothetical protein
MAPGTSGHVCHTVIVPMPGVTAVWGMMSTRTRMAECAENVEVRREVRGMRRNSETW